MYNDIAEREQRIVNEYADREHVLLQDAASMRNALLAHDQHARELEAQREQILVRDAQSARQELLADIQRQRDREAQREVDMRRDMYDLAAQRSRAAALEAELKCLKANIGPCTVAYQMPVQLDDIPPPEVTAAVPMSPLRPAVPVTPIDNIVVQGLPTDIATALTWHSVVEDVNPYAEDADTSTDDCHGAGITSQTPHLSFAVSELTGCRAGPCELPQLQPSNLGSHHESDTCSRLPVQTFPREMPQLTSALPRQLDTRAIMSDPVHAHMPVRAFSRSVLQPPCTQSTMTSMLSWQPPCVPTRSPTHVDPPPSDHVLISALPRPLPVPGDLPYVDNAMQRVTQRVDNTNVCTHSIERLLADLTPPPPVNRQSVPLLSEHTQTTATEYMNTDSIPSLLAHRYADYYQNISANLSLPSLSTHTNVPTHVSVPLSQVALGQSNVTQPNALYAVSYASDLNSSGLIALNPNIVRTSYADHIPPQPIAVEHAGLSAFSRTDVPYSQSTTVQYTVGTSVSASIAPLQSPSVHWRKQLAYDYVQPDTGLGAPTHTAPVIYSGYIRPQTSDTHTHIQIVCTCKTCHLETVI